jgi:catechol 2,3-dioxygenase-like lactoylglutathione lyase family enzyme
MNIRSRLIFAVLASLLLSIAAAKPEELQRPEIWGIAKATFLVSDFNMARDYYGRFLGFSEAFSYDSERGKILSFKVNDRQFLEFIEDPQAKSKDRLVSFSFETENVEQMRQYLQKHGQKVPDKTAIDGAGNEVFLIHDPAGNPIEFLHFGDGGLHKKSQGKFLSEQRISKRIHHVGLYSDKIIDDDPFYAGILKFIEIVRFPDDRKVSPTLLYLGMGDCVENIEFSSPGTKNFTHACFLVDDMQQTIYTLKERKINETLAKPMIGRGKRWLLNIKNPDNTRIEFTEAHTVR